MRITAVFTEKYEYTPFTWAEKKVFSEKKEDIKYIIKEITKQSNVTENKMSIRRVK